MPLGHLPKEGDVIICRYGDDKRNSFVPFKLRPVIVIDRYIDTATGLPILSVVPVTSSPGKNDRFRVNVMDMAENWRPADGVHSHVMWASGFELPNDKIFFPILGANGQQHIIGHVVKHVLDHIKMMRAIGDIDHNRSLLEKFSADPTSIIHAVPKKFRDAVPEGTRDHRGIEGRPPRLKKLKNNPILKT